MSEKVPVYIECKDGIMDFATLPKDRAIVFSHVKQWEVQQLKIAAQLFIEQDRFLYLKDSVRILQPEKFWQKVDETKPSENTYIFSDKNCYLGIFKSEMVIKNLANVHTSSKQESFYNEWKMHQLLPGEHIWDLGNLPWPNGNELNTYKRTEFWRGELESVHGNDVVEKWKGHTGCPCGNREFGYANFCEHLVGGTK